MTLNGSEKSIWLAVQVHSCLLKDMSIVNSNTDTASVELLLSLLGISFFLQFHDNVAIGFPPDCWQVNVTSVPLLYWNPDGEAVILGGKRGGGSKKINKWFFVKLCFSYHIQWMY